MTTITSLVHSLSRAVRITFYHPGFISAMAGACPGESPTNTTTDGRGGSVLGLRPGSGEIAGAQAIGAAASENWRTKTVLRRMHRRSRARFS